jgi:hypothetical protein
MKRVSGRFPYKFDLHSLDGAPFEYDEMVTWLRVHVGHGYRLSDKSFIDPVQWANAPLWRKTITTFRKRMLRVHLRDKNAAFAFKMRWSTDLHTHEDVMQRLEHHYGTQR